MATQAEHPQVHPEALEPGTRIATWRVVERLGVGGYGAVYRVEDVARPGTFYALKLALRRRDERAEREVRLLMDKAAHPHVVPFHTSGRWPHPERGWRYFVMGWIQGPPVDTWAETRNPSSRQVAAVAGKVALALDALHARGVLHRDLKPAHVLIRQSDGEPILIDLGVGHFEGADPLTVTVLPPATPHLLSPEAVRFFLQRDKPPGARYPSQPTDDLHALGVTLYRVVTGHYPYDPGQPPELLYAAIERLVPPEPTAFNRRMPRALGDVITRLLAKNPRERFQSGRQVHAALVEALAGEGAWDAALFDWEEVSAEPRAEGAPPRRIRRPEWPTEEWTSGRERMRGSRPGAPGPRGLPGGAPPPAALATPAPGEGRGAAWGAAGLGVCLALLAWNLELRGRAPLPAPTAMTLERPLASPPPAPGQEVASASRSPESGGAAAPPKADATPAAVAPTTHPQDTPAVKKQKKKASPAPAPGLGPVGRTLGVGTALVGLACSGPGAQMRAPPPPPAEPCSSVALAAMKRLGIDIDDEANANFFKFGEGYGDITIRLGEATLHLTQELGSLPQRTLLSGQLFLGEGRLHGRFTAARPPDGPVFPVCLDLLDEGAARGVIMESAVGSDGVKIGSAVVVRAVGEFE